VIGFSPWVLCPSGRSFFFRNSDTGKDDRHLYGWKTWLCTIWVKRIGCMWGICTFLTQCNSFLRSTMRETIWSPVWRSPTMPHRTACQTNSLYRKTIAWSGYIAKHIEHTISSSYHQHFLSFVS
jgi:hypothetical protein